MRSQKGLIILQWGWLVIPIFLYQCRTWSSVEVSPLGIPPYPANNITTQAKIDLGRKLFFDKRLSRDNTVSCATCHVPEFGFTDRMRRSTGVAGAKTDRNSPTLLNAAWLDKVMFDAHLETLEMQVTVPIQEHVEMDITVVTLLERLRKIPEYQKAAKEIYDRDFDAWVLTRSIAAFERSLVSESSRFDQYYYGQVPDALSKSEIRGWKIFSEQLYCTKCHVPPHFTNFKAACNGLYVDYGKDQGRFRVTHDTLDMGMYKVPSLRNIELTYPYMHDGSLWTLDDVLDHYSKGGEGHKNQNKEIQAFVLKSQERKDLKNFLRSLTDTTYMQRFR